MQHIIPIQTRGHVADKLIVILTGESLARMAKADPAEVRCNTLGCELVNPAILICHEEESPELTAVLATGDLKTIVNFLQRGFVFLPEKGDHDGPPEVIRRVT